MSHLLGLLMVLSSIVMYTKGETYTKLLGRPNSWFKYLMGVPIALFSWNILPVITYFIACELPYGEKSPITRLVGDRWAVTIVGTCLGLASFPLIGFWAILSGLISGGMFYYLNVMNGKINEPWVAILRGLAGTICLTLY